MSGEASALWSTDDERQLSANSGLVLVNRLNDTIGMTLPVNLESDQNYRGPLLPEPSLVGVSELGFPFLLLIAL